MDYPQAIGLLPDTLGHVSIDKGTVVLKLSDKIIKIDSAEINNPFWAVAKNQTNGYFTKDKYFSAGDLVGEKDLVNGIKLNSAFGNRDSRVSIRVINYAGNKYINIPSEGIHTIYAIQSDTNNVFGICLNTEAPYEVGRVFSFKKSTKKNAYYTLDIQTNGFYNATYELKQNNITIQSSSGNSLQFEVGGYLFSLQPKYTLANILFYILVLTIVVSFQVMLLRTLGTISSPLIFSAIALRVHFNNLFLIAAPIFFTALVVTNNRGWYLLSLILINLSYFLPKNLLHGLRYQATKIWTLLLISLLIGLPILMYLKHSHEALFGIPILHFQKLLTLILIYFSQTKIFQSISVNYWFKLVVFTFYSFLLSLITSDIGSFLYTVMALLLIELVKASVSKRKVVIFGAIIAISVVAIYHLIPNAFSDHKLYRIVSPYTNPSSSNVTHAPEADKETYSYLHLIQKALVLDEAPTMNSVVIPGNMRSTSFSDYALFFSIVFGKIVFLILFLSIYFFLMGDLIRLLYAALRPMRINKEYSFVLPHNRESAFIAFLISFAVISFSYPLFSNILAMPLTGQSLPFISTSNFEGFYYLLFLIPVSSFFTNPKYIFSAKTLSYTYSAAEQSRVHNLKLLALFVILVISIKIFFIFSSSSSAYFWNKQSDTDTSNADSTNVLSLNKKQLIAEVQKQIKDESITSVQNKKKVVLRNFATTYHKAKTYAQINQPRFENSLDKVAYRINLDSLLLISKKQISGKSAPFGTVYAINHQINNNTAFKVSNPYYGTISSNSKTLNNDLTAVLCRSIETHLNRIGIPINTGAILIVDNNSGAIISNASYPISSERNEMNVVYLGGSVKKIILAYCALAINPDYSERKFNGKSFAQFIQWSDDVYASSLLKDIMLNHQDAFKNILEKDFDLPFTSGIIDAYFQTLPDKFCYSKSLDSKNYLYRIAIGQEKPYMLSDIVKWYARIASGKKLALHNSTAAIEFGAMSLDDEHLTLLKSYMNLVITSGTASKVGNALKSNGIITTEVFGKTGTAQLENSNKNQSSSLIFCTGKYTIGIRLNGEIPESSVNLTAKDLMISIIPILKQYNILYN
ncbi:MAG: hypothetical protein M9888_04840 [Chitinophagales bacterium]|nr:hypothetical protein [Chitinophagales bacterium]